jgi:pimeloyl-ACP methyl ester carboxylesterase
MAGHPNALYGMADSPVGLASWILDNDLWSQELIARAADGQGDGLTRDDILDNITLYWLTDTAISSSRLYQENKLAFFAPMGVKVPVAVSAFAEETFQLPQTWAERAYPKLMHYSKVDKGGHFAAWEQPKLFTEELRAGLRALRS